MLNGFILDCESDGFFFQGTKIWCIHFEDLDSEDKYSFNPFEEDRAVARKKFLDYLDRYDNPIVAFHYGLGYDMFAIMKHLDISFTVGPDTIEGRPVRFTDTLYWSMFLNPDRVGHSIEAFGERLGLHKIDWRQRAIELGLITEDAPDGAEFQQWHPEMGAYCARDVAVNKKVFMFLLGEHQSYYGWTGIFPDSYKCGQKSFFLMSCQDFAGWKFDIDKANALIPRIQGMMEELRAEVEPQLPPRSLKKGEEKFYSMPKNPYKKDGTYSSHMINFIAKHNAKEIEHGKIEAYGKTYQVASELLLDVKLPMEMANQDQLKDWLLEIGWEPEFWNFKKGPDGKPERDPKTRQLIQTSPKIQEAQKICPNLEAMDMPIIKQVVKWLSLRNRQSVLTGWLNNERLQMDGRIGAARTGIAATHRQKHNTLVNVPKASEKVLLGKEFRELFTSEEGFWIAAGDAAALEGRVQGHYCVPMDTQALTKTGWKNYEGLVVGEDILAYDPDKEMKVWTPLLEKVKFKDAETFTLKNKQFNVRATGNHRWFVEYRNTGKKTYEKKIVETKDLNTCCNIIVNAPMEEFCGSNFKLKEGKYHIDWTERVLSYGSQGITAFLEGFLIADGHYSNQNAKKGEETFDEGKGRWRFGQNLGAHFDAALTAAYLTTSGYLNVTHRKTNTMGIVTLNKRSLVTCQKMQIERFGIEDVWCPRTKFGSWVMRQKDVITITGNTYKYDNGETARELLDGDIHSKTAKSVYEDELKDIDIKAEDFSKDDPFFKPFRDRSKNVYYAGLYGAGPPKLAKVAGLPESQGKEISDKFWAANAATKKLKDNLELYWENSGKKKYLPGIDGRYLMTRKKSALLNTIFQSCGGIVMDYAGCFMDTWLGAIHWDEMWRPYYLYKGKIVRRIGYFHDEYEYECEGEEIAHEVGAMIEKAIEKAGAYLKIKVELKGEAKCGKNWSETH
jgi:hypothetical protein